jgi:hypothetical protein
MGPNHFWFTLYPRCPFDQWSHMTVSVFVGTSLEGFIVLPNGNLDFLPVGGGEPHGYLEFMASGAALVIGRNTFETVLAFTARP